MNIYNHYGYNIEEVVEYEYIRQRNTGRKSWEEFKKIRDEFFNDQNNNHARTKKKRARTCKPLKRD